MVRTSPSSALAAALLWLFLASFATAASLEQQVRECVGISDAEQRLACYDSLGRKLEEAPASSTKPSVAEGTSSPTTASAPAAAATTATASSRKTPDENLGGYKFKDPEEDPDEMAMATRVIECQKERGSGSWYFRFENQQVWKQVDRRTLNFQGCDFPVKVSSDGFGYVMRIEGREGKIRVSRRK